MISLTLVNSSNTTVVVTQRLQQQTVSATTTTTPSATRRVTRCTTTTTTTQQVRQNQHPPPPPFFPASSWWIFSWIKLQATVGCISVFFYPFIMVDLWKMMILSLQVSLPEGTFWWFTGYHSNIVLQLLVISVILVAIISQIADTKHGEHRFCARDKR